MNNLFKVFGLRKSEEIRNRHKAWAKEHGHHPGLSTQDDSDSIPTSWKDTKSGYQLMDYHKLAEAGERDMPNDPEYNQTVREHISDWGQNFARKYATRGPENELLNREGAMGELSYNTDMNEHYTNLNYTDDSGPRLLTENSIRMLYPEQFKEGAKEVAIPRNAGDYHIAQSSSLQNLVKLLKESQSGGHYGGSDLSVDQSTHPKELKKKKYIEMVKQAFGVTTHRGATQASKIGNKKQSRFNERFKNMSGSTTQAGRRAQNQAMRGMRRNPNAMTQQGIQRKKLNRTGTNVAGGN